MSQTLLILSFVAKAAGLVAALNGLPFVSPSTGVIIFFIASLVKDTVNRIGDFLDNGKTDWRALVVWSAIAGFALFGATGCGTTTSTTASDNGTPVAGGSGTTQAAVTKSFLQTVALDFKGATNDALSFANALQKQNNGNALPPAAVTEILTLTHNSGDATTAAVLNNLLGQFIAAQATATTPTQSITNVNQVLAPANVQTTTQAVVPAVAPPAPTTADPTTVSL